MKSTLIFILIAFSCSGCLKYQYVTISSNLQQHQTQELTLENDTLKLKYEFTGLGGPVKVIIHNKLNYPIYIDWSKSALIVGDQRISYWNKSSTIDASISSDEIKWTRQVSSSSGTIQGTVTHKEAISFIPPNSFVAETPVVLRYTFFKTPMPTKKNKKVVNNVTVKSYQHDSNSSPLKFRSFITLSTTENFELPLYFDHDFWASEVIETIVAPTNFPANSNQFYLSKSTGVGAVVGVAALTGLVIIGAAQEEQ